MTKEQKRIYNQEYRKNHKKEIAIKQKEYHERYKKEINIKQKEYRERHKNEINIKQKEYRERHKEEIKGKQKDYYEKHKEEIKMQQKNYSESCKKENKFPPMKNEHVEKFRNGTKKSSKMYEKFNEVDELRDELKFEDITLNERYDKHLLNNYGIHRYFSEKHKNTIQYCE